jgi:orotate phosphoribosyltransferase
MLGEELRELKTLLETRSYFHREREEEPFTLASGRKSRYYYDAKWVTLGARGQRLVGHILLRLIRELGGVDAVGGLEIGAVPMATATAFASELEGHTIPSFIVRKHEKTHGTMGKVAQGRDEDGSAPIARGRRVAVFDDVVTTGDSVEKAIERVEADGAEVVAVVVLVCRTEAAGRQNIENKGYDFYAIFDADERDGGKLHLSKELARLLQVPA